MIKREGYSKRMERNLAAWRARFETERAAAEKAGAALKAEVREKLESAKVAGDAAFAKLRELRSAAARWSELRNEMELAWRAIRGEQDEDSGSDGASASSPPPRRASEG